MIRRRDRQRPFRLLLDRLESRDCPVVTVVQHGNHLVLTGDAADDWVAVCDEGGQTVEVQTATATQTFRGVRAVVGNLGEGADTFEFHQAERPSESLSVRIDLAAGDDRFLYPELPGGQAPPEPGRPIRYVLDVQTGAGNDLMIVGPEYVPGLGVEIRADLGDGGDAFEFHQGERPMESLNVAVDLGAGDDRFLYPEPPAGQAPPEPDTPAKWYFDVRAGFGNDVAIIQPCVVPGLDLTVVANLGDGDDILDAGFQYPAEAVGTIQPCISLGVDAGEGNDAVLVAVGNPDITEAPRVEDIRIGIRGFGGDDSAIVGMTNVNVTGGLTQTVDLGGGDDSLMTTLSNLSVRGSLKQSATGGDGADEVGIIINGRIGALAQKVHTGEGDDRVSLSWNGCYILGPVMTRVNLGAGDDEAVALVDESARFTGSFALSVDAGGGDDSASVLVTDPENSTAFAGPVALRVRLGEGDDLANVVVRDANAVAGPLTVAIAGEAGNDGMVADVDFTPRVGARQLDPGNAPASVLVSLAGGDGLDTIDAYTEGVWNGVARFALRGGAGDDDLGFHSLIGEGSTGALAVVLDGASGDDVLEVGINLGPNGNLVPVLLRLLGGTNDDVLSMSLLGGPDTTPEPHLYVLDGGAGFDLARAPTGAVVRNCELRF